MLSPLLQTHATQLIGPPTNVTHAHRYLSERGLCCLSSNRDCLRHPLQHMRENENPNALSSGMTRANPLCVWGQTVSRPFIFILALPFYILSRFYFICCHLMFLLIVMPLLAKFTLPLLFTRDFSPALILFLISVLHATYLISCNPFYF